MNKTALYFGLWAAFCMALAVTGFFAIVDLGAEDAFRDSMFDGPNPGVRAISFLLPFCIPAGIVAGLGWALAHRGGREPGWVGYGLLALLIVAASHLLIFGTASVTAGEIDIVELAYGLAFMFLLHGWITVPVALFGTAIFVLWDRQQRRGVAI